ncbi:hypothetical protein ES706_02527 [subsurface metagenome]
MTVQLSTRIDPKVKQILSQLHHKKNPHTYSRPNRESYFTA